MATFEKKSSKIIRKEDLLYEHFLFEHKYFSTFEKCPKSFEEYKDSFPFYPIFSYCYLDNGNIIALRLLMRISDIHLHTMLILLEKKIRSQGIAKKMILEKNKMVQDLGFKYITEFSVFPELSKSINSNEITSYINYSVDNSCIYNKLISAVNPDIKQSGYNNKNMIYNNYYQMKEKQSKDACFLAFLIQ